MIMRLKYWLLRSASVSVIEFTKPLQRDFNASELGRYELLEYKYTIEEAARAGNTYCRSRQFK